MPWALFDRPSLQLASLKSYIQKKGESLKVSAHPAYLEVAAFIGYELYHAVSQRSWFAESAYALLLFPEKQERIQSLLNSLKKSSKWPEVLKFDSAMLQDKLRVHSEKFLTSIDWAGCHLAGFSICFNQLTSSLYAIKALKKACPGIPIVAGGSSCSGEMGRSLLLKCPEIDFVVTGEGERPLLSIVYYLMGRSEKPGPGVYYRVNGGINIEGERDQIESLDTLPIPDFSDYFKCLESIPCSTPFIPTLPLEFSRGCWWGKCRFCNLNLQWSGYRKKSTERVLQEIESVSDQFGTANIAFTDNSLPPHDSAELFKKLLENEKDFDFFAELRAGQSADDLKIMRKAGLRNVQIGIEALSTALLKKMSKGATAIQNIEIMKHCEELGIVQSGNLIVVFPGSNGNDVEETMRNLDYVWPFYPLTVARFWLGYGSPVFNQAQKLGLTNIRNHPNYQAILSDDLFSKLITMQQDFRADKLHQEKIWKPVIRKVMKWGEEYHRLRRRFPPRPLLSYIDAGRSMIVRQTNADGSIRMHRLRGASRDIYLHCRTARFLAEIRQSFPKHSAETLTGFLAGLVDKRIMFNEGDVYLSLAVVEDNTRLLSKNHR